MGCADEARPYIFNGTSQMKQINMTIDSDVLDAYSEYYFSLHPRAKKRPIKQPYHESINTWMILKRAAMNALKQRWKDFIIWFVNEQGYTNLRIEKCEISQTIFYPNNRRHDVDNGVPKFVLDGFVDSGMIVDDDFRHVNRLILSCDVDKEHPRTELSLRISDECKEDA